EDAEQQIGLTPPAGIADAAGGNRAPRAENDLSGNQDLWGEQHPPAAKGMPPPETKFANRRLHLDPEDDQRVQPEGGEMAEKAQERDQRRSDQPQPNAGRLQPKPQRRAAHCDPEPEQVVDKAPQELPVVEKGHGQQWPQPPPARGEAVGRG